MKTQEPPQPPPRQEDADVREPADFSDPESQSVWNASADALVGELARQAARECFAAVKELP